MAARLGHGHLERHPGPSGRLLEHHGHRPALQPPGEIAGKGLGLGGELEELVELRLRDVVHRQEMPGHEASLSVAPRMEKSGPPRNPFRGMGT
jgi:hypothetical protein